MHSYLSVFDPRRMAADDQRDENKLLLRNLLQHLVDAGRVQEEEADVITNEYARCIDEVVAKDKSKYSDFQSSPNSEGDTDRIDVLFYDTVSSNKAFSKLWQVVKQALVLFHGQASVERGFSVNKEVEAENLDTSTVAAKRLICNHVRAIGGLMNIDIHNKQLHVSCSTARQRYFTYLADQKKMTEDEGKGRKRKAIADEVDDLKSKKQKLQIGKDSLTAAADDFADQAEKQHKLTLIAKSNVMRKSAREKEAELNAVEQQLQDKLLQLSSE